MPHCQRKASFFLISYIQSVRVLNQMVTSQIIPQFHEHTVLITMHLFNNIVIIILVTILLHLQYCSFLTRLSLQLSIENSPR